MSECNEQLLHDYFYQVKWEIAGDLSRDYRHLYSRGSLAVMGGSLGVAAAFANTSIDEDFRSWLMRRELTEPNVDCWYDELGSEYMVLATVATLAISFTYRKQVDYDSQLATMTETWAYRSSRAMLIGSGPVFVWQRVIGSSRPGESSAGSDWKPFDDENGVSSHAFIGAVPFLVAAKMSKRPVVKAAFVAGSGLAGYGQLCKDKHYLSQVIMGWTIACLSVEAATRTDNDQYKYRLVPLDVRGFHGLGIELRH
ncbi:MAG: hypothetical protein ACR2NP_13490 [Pirellulaceae bacterium]